MKLFVLLFVLLFVSVTLFVGCKDNSILEAEIEISLDKEIYEISDLIQVEFEVKTNQTMLFIEGKVIDENEITISSIANISTEGKEITGSFSLELTNESLASGTYTVQLLIGTATDTKRAYQTFELIGVERELVSLMVSESTLGTSMIHKINVDGSSTIWRSEPYTMDILTVNSRRQFIAYAYNENQQYSCYNLGGSQMATGTNGLQPSGGYYLDGSSSDNESFVGTDQGELFVLNSTGVNSQTPSYSNDFKLHTMDYLNDKLVMFQKSHDSFEGRIAIYHRPTNFLEQTYSITHDISSTYSDNSNYVWFLGDDRLYEFNLNDFTLQELTVGTSVDKIMGIRNDQLLISTPTGYMTYNRTLQTYTETSELYHEIFYEPLNDWLIKANGGMLTAEQFDNGEIEINFSYDGAIADLEFLYTL